MSNMMKTCHPMYRLLRNLPTGYSEKPLTFASFPDNTNGLFSSITMVDLWTDGNYVYYEDNSGDYVLKNGVWEAVTWDEGYASGRYTWTDGTNIYYSYSGMHKVLEGNSWKEKTWQGCTGFDGDEIWTDGTNIYCYYMTTNYVLNGDTWERASVAGKDPTSIWTDGTHIYYSYYQDSTNDQYELVDGEWVTKTWNGLTAINAQYIWTDGTHIYYSSYTSSYILEGDTWVSTNFNKNVYGIEIWTDGIRVFNGINRVLLPAKADLYINNADGWSKLGEFNTNIITFTINNINYEAKSGMTWYDWLQSDYSSEDFTNDASGMVYVSGNYIMYNGSAVLTGHDIIAGAAYTTET